MKYKIITEGEFISRPNRFVAYVFVDGKEELCHVKNTGRLGELLKKGSKVYLEKSENPKRKTKYDIIAVYKGDALINIDSQASNKIFGEWIIKSNYFGEIIYLKPEAKYENSRFDFYIETKEKKIFVEVKGVTLEDDGVLKFPDAPTARGIKHIKELKNSVEDGYEAYVFFIVQMEKVKYFTPNKGTHSEFYTELLNASKSGVQIKCLNCCVDKHSITAKSFVDVKF